MKAVYIGDPPVQVYEASVNGAPMRPLFWPIAQDPLGDPLLLEHRFELRTPDPSYPPVELPHVVIGGGRVVAVWWFGYHVVRSAWFYAGPRPLPDPALGSILTQFDRVLQETA